MIGGTLEGIPWLLTYAKRVNRIVKQNLIWAFGYNSVALLVVSLAPVAAGLGGALYLAGALLLGLGLTLAALQLARVRSLVAARYLFLASVLYLPALTSLLLVANL